VPARRTRRALPWLPVLVLLALAACVSTPPRLALPVTVQPPSGAAAAAPSCRDATALTWVRPASADGQARLDAWCEAVGPPLIRIPPRTAASPAAATRSRGVTVISWNTHGGLADVDRLLRDIVELDAEGAARPAIVLLLQEVVRRSRDVPSNVPTTVRVPRALSGDARGEDVDMLAQRLGLSLVYVPSMRNGRGGADRAGEDRGNAILTSGHLDDLTAIELPFGQQRRVAVAATVSFPQAAPSAIPLRVASFHFDTRGGRVAQARFLARYLADAVTHGHTLVAGGDVNAVWGTRDDAYEALAAALPVAACGRGRTHRWRWRLDAVFGWWLGRLDYIFGPTADGGRTLTCRTWPSYLGSDHLPVIVRIGGMEEGG